MVYNRISTYDLVYTTRLSTMQLQNDLNKAQTELTSGRHADQGLALGVGTGDMIELRTRIDNLDTQISTNKSTLNRLDMTQTALGALRGQGERLVDTLTASLSTTTGPSLTADTAASELKSLTSLLNQTVNGAYLFGGENSGERPLENYFGTPAPASRLAVEAAFTAEFGFAPGDPAAQSITPAAMESFLDNAFAQLFEPAGWAADWSTASDKPIMSRIGDDQTVATSLSANEQAMRKMTMGFVMAAGLGVEALSDATFDALATKAIGVIGSGMSALSEAQGGLAATQERISRENDYQGTIKGLWQQQLSEGESVDPYETASRVNSLVSQLELSYTLTGRLQGLRLSNYI